MTKDESFNKLLPEEPEHYNKRNYQKPEKGFKTFENTEKQN